MAIVRSEKRSPVPISFKFEEDIVLTSTGAVNVHIPFIVNHVDFFPSSFKLEAHKKVIFIDPLVVDHEEPADYILITHAHQDHFSIEDIRKLLKKETMVMGPKKVYKKLSKALMGCTIKNITPGEKISFEAFTIESIAAYNLKSGFLTPHPKSAMNVGYIIGIGGVRLYHTGDTDYIPEMDQLKDMTAVLTPIDGGNLTMSTEKAAVFINHVKPEFVIPMHYNIGTDQIEHFKGLMNRNTKILIMDGQ